MIEGERTRVMVVDDHYVVRAGIATMLLAADDIELVGEAADGEEALEKCAEVEPDVVLMDLRLPKMDGIAATRALREHDPSIQVLALTSFSDEQLVRDAVQAGVTGFLLKDVGMDELIRAIRAARHGKRTFSPGVTESLLTAGAAKVPGDPSPPRERLTEREAEVLRLVVKGLHNQEIATKLFITPATVKYHVQRLFAKLGVASRTELVAEAIQRHLV
jgi:DNA-binding NarL/FixJ family response regulator